MIEELGKFLRKLRILNDESAKLMAEKIGISSSYLSAVELGKRPCPQDWEEKINAHYELDKKDKQELHVLIKNSQKRKRKIKLGKIDEKKRNLVMQIVDNEFDDSTIEKLCAIVEVKRKERNSGD